MTGWNRLNFPFRFIPTCVGSIADFTLSQFAFQVHPHVCGEHLAGLIAVQPLKGSSPRVWGALEFPAYDDSAGRFIPTCVGSMNDATSCHSALKGSSPRVWGAYHAHRSARPLVRFIPTCVGSIASKPGWMCSTTVHPHVCGEHRVVDLVHANVGGSSPRVWGASSPVAQRTASARFIPTCVGSMNLGCSPSSPSAVHPHVCGEHTKPP